MSAEIFSESFGSTHAGKHRERNNDAFLADDQLGLYAVCDGLGAHEQGGRAAQLTLEQLKTIVEREKSVIEAVRAGDSAPEALELLLQHAVLEACAAVYNRACSEPALAGMGATLSALVVAGGNAVLAHVGNCRIYLLRQRKLSQLTRDHTLAAEQVQALRPRNAKNATTSNSLSRVIGMQPSVSVDTLVMELLPGDRVLLCSDGYSRYLRDAQALSNQLLSGAPAAVAPKLTDAANLAGGEDNITCVVVAIDSKSADPARSSAIIERYAALGQVFLLKDLGMPLLARVVAQSERPVHAAGDVVVAVGEPCDQLMVVLAGEYVLERDGVRVGHLSSGDHLGTTLLFNPRRARATLKALTNGQLLVLAAEQLQRLLRQRPWLGMGLLQRLGERLSADLERSYNQREGSTEHSEDSEQF